MFSFQATFKTFVEIPFTYVRVVLFLGDQINVNDNLNDKMYMLVMTLRKFIKEILFIFDLIAENIVDLN